MSALSPTRSPAQCFGLKYPETTVTRVTIGEFFRAVSSLIGRMTQCLDAAAQSGRLRLRDCNSSPRLFH
jgi:hypothetical protein